MTDRFVLVDTNVVSYLFRNDTYANDYRKLLAPFEVRLIAFQTLAELEFWAEIAAWGRRRRADLAYFLEGYEVVHSDDEVCRTWAKLRSERRSRGRMPEPEDAWIAAIALELGCPLATHNARDFDGIPGLRILTA